MIQEAMTVLDDIQYAHSNEYKAKLQGLETMLGFTQGEQRKPYSEEYTSDVLRYGGRTERSWELEQRLAKQRKRGILQSKAPHLDNGIPQAQVTDTPCTEGETDMAKRYKIPYTMPNGEKEFFTGETMTDVITNVLKRCGNLAQAPKKVIVPTVKEFVENTYKPTYFNTLKPKTTENYHQYLKQNILPFLGDKRLDEVDVTTIQQFYNWMATAADHGRKKNINAKSIERVSGFTSRIFKVAQEMGIIQDTPFKKTLLKINAESAGHHKALPDAEIDRIKMAIPQLANDDERLYMTLLAFTGIRLEELLGFMWEDFNLDKQFCIIKRAVTHPKNNHYHVDTPKSEYSDRTVTLPQPVVEILRPLAKSSGYILGGCEPWCYSKMKRTSDRAKKHLGIIGYNNHDFRTTFGTQVCEDGASSKECSVAMGHGDSRMVERVYARPRHESAMKLLPRLERMNRKYSKKVDTSMDI